MSAVECVSIQPIDKTTVNRICSGQVVLNLSTAVKELLENSIDAGADSIQVKLEEYGSESIEVIDNGCGVEEVDFQALNLYSVETFGFRGEALSSLCSLSDVTITTQHKNAEIGATLKFDHNGIIIKNMKTLRKTGTTVKLENLFNTFPIRRTEFLKNLKKEYFKMCNILYAYGLQSKGVRITCTNHVLKSKHSIKESQGENIKRSTSSIIMDTKGDSLESNIVSVFGIRQKKNLLRITETLPTQETLNEFSLEGKNIDLQKFKLEGYISSCAHGCGRSSSDRQYYFINSRPIDHQEISKLVNDIYHQYNHHQDPFVVLNIKAECGSYDMNVTPDKRQILLQNEKLLFAVLKESLNAVFRSIPATMEVQNLGVVNGLLLREESGIKKKFEKFKARFNLDFIKSLEKTDSKKEAKSNKETSLKFLPFTKTIEASVSNIAPEEPTSFRIKPRPFTPTKENKTFLNDPSVTTLQTSPQTETIFETLENEKGVVKEQEIMVNSNENSQEILKNEEKFAGNCETRSASSRNVQSKRKLYEKLKENEPEPESDPKKMRFDEGLSAEVKKKRTTILHDITLCEIKKLYLKNTEKSSREQEQADVKFLAEIKPQNNERAENELKKELKKDSFAKMEIIGQFNLGFIITKLAFDLFIIDQHASDEKYNYETLQATTIMQTQKLINPEKLQLTVDKEELMLQHEDVFKKNGFDFVFDQKANLTTRISLTSIPMSNNYVFGKDDVDELLFLLEDTVEIKNLRPSRVNSMFASRACRKSVMIGTPLNHQEMRRIVDHMGEMQHPWNCPHGRPTMRHLVNLKMIFLKE